MLLSSRPVAKLPCSSGGLSHRSLSHPAWPCRHDQEAHSGLGVGRVHGLRFAAKGGYPRASQWPGCGEGHIQVRLRQAGAPTPPPPSHCLVFIEPMDFLTQQYPAGKENVAVHPLWCDHFIRPYRFLGDNNRTCLPAVAQVWSR